MSERLPEIEQHWNSTRIPLTFPIGELYRDTPRVGLVIGTFAAIPYVHLQLEARRRFFPNTPTLVHDDCSPRTAELADLCRAYGCAFESNSVRLPPTLGDISAFVGGLKWAEILGIDVLLKVSRRWIFTVDWTESLSQLARQSQHATFTNYTQTFNYGFRTECVALSVREWGTSRFLRSACELIETGRPLFVEAYLHQLAISLSHGLSPHARKWIADHPMPEGRKGYAPWPLMGTDRCIPPDPPTYLWHDSHTPADYAAQALAWGLPYQQADFEDPNQGAGLSEATAPDRR